ncbi:MAG: 5'/3'-nucleotidase SurE [Myxococcales bacterium]|nr:5'/3'-nucleotidase SurE [Myxococcales bacterium]
MPLILVTNDDGIQSSGIRLLADALEPLGEVIVVAPARQQSAVSRKITLGEPLRVRRVAERRLAVSGTPADAVFLALHFLLEGRKPDLVVSGINLGCNIGTDLFYSGTVAGALEATSKGIAAIAVSQELPHREEVAPQDSEEAQKAERFDELAPRARLEPLLETAAAFAAELSAVVLERGLPQGMALNVNVPNRPATRFRWTQVGGRVYRGDVEMRRDPRGLPYYWIGGPHVERPEPEGSDSRAVQDGVISVSPLWPSFAGDHPPGHDGWSLGQGFSRDGKDGLDVSGKRQGRAGEDID